MTQILNWIKKLNPICWWLNTSPRHTQFVCGLQQFLKIRNRFYMETTNSLKNRNKWTAVRKDVKTMCSLWLGSNPSPLRLQLNNFFLTKHSSQVQHTRYKTLFPAHWRPVVCNVHVLYVHFYSVQYIYTLAVFSTWMISTSRDSVRR